jgi:DNA sulfur modification protein DndE
VTEETPVFQNIHMKNIICNGAARAVRLQGLPEMPIQKITMENIIISADSGVTCIDAENISFKNVKIISRQGPVFELHNSRDLTMDNIDFADSDNIYIKLSGPKTDVIRLKGTHNSNSKIEYGQDVKANALIID